MQIQEIMKTILLLSATILLLFLSVKVISQEVANKNTTIRQAEATVMCSPDLYELTSRWVSEYNTLNPEKRIKVVSTPFNSTNFSASENLSFVSNKSRTAIGNEKNWKMVVGRDVIVPIVNTANPYLKEILQKGVNEHQFAQLFTNADKQNWGALLANNQNSSVHIYILKDEAIMAAVAKFIHADQLPINGIVLGTKEEVVSAIQNDPLAIGFCNIADIIVPGDQNLTENVRLLPIDKNGNGTIDYMEDIYKDANTFLRGVWIGKYPKTLYSNIYAVSTVVPVNEMELAFLSWVLADGQQFMNSAGFCALAGSESQSQIENLNTSLMVMAPGKETSQTGTILVILAVLIIVGLVTGFVIRKYRKPGNIVEELAVQTRGFDENAVVLPQGLYFNNAHTWAFMEKDGNISIGIDDFLQHITGPITKVEMKDPGEKIKKGDLLFSIIQSGKQLNLYSPVTGTIKKQNDALITNSSYINSSPYSEGWVYMIEPSNWFKEIQFMDMSEKYKRWIDNEFLRVKDFFAATLKPESLEYSHMVFQDGGLLKDGVLTDFGPEVWDDFQTNFLDTYK